ncbi:MAG TPA: hypothetical protein VF718_12780 [Allosphingosinicella sp.]
MADPPKALATPSAWNGPPPRYRRAIAIAARQPYYNLRSDAACFDLAIAPTAGTAERLRRHSVLWRPRRDGGDLLVPGGAPAALAGEPPLMFTVEIERPAFSAVTDLPPGFGGGAATLCLSNRHSRAGTGDEAAITPDWSRSIGVEAALERAASLRRNEPRPSPAPKDSRIEGWAASGEAAAFLDEAARQATGTRLRRLPFALLEIHLSEPVDAAGDGGVYPLSPGPAADLAPVQYQLQFEPRRTRWRYVIAIRGNAVDAATLSVGDAAEKPILFEADDSGVGPLPGADQTRAFLSAEPIALAQRPLRSFYLQGERGAGRRGLAKLVDPLPGPGPDALLHRGGGDDASALVSEIYVYL